MAGSYPNCIHATAAQAPVVVSRRVAPVVCSAAVEVEAEPAPVKCGVAKQTFQRGSVHKVNVAASPRTQPIAPVWPAWAIAEPSGRRSAVDMSLAFAASFARPIAALG